MRWLWLKFVRFLGVVANLAGMPGIVRDCDYRSEGLDVCVRVRRSPLFTTVTVNGIDVYFYRLTGGIDGVGTSAAGNCESLSDLLCEKPE